jgi:hypothetical protein
MADVSCMKRSNRFGRRVEVTPEPLTSRPEPAMVGPLLPLTPFALSRSPMRPIFATSSFAMLVVLTTACPPTNPPPSPPDVETGTPSSSCASCYTSTLDNPVMQDSVTLANRTGPEGEVSDESVSTDANGTIYYNFFLQLVTSGNDSVGSVSETLPILPYNAASYDIGDTMTWNAFGMELGYSYSLLQGQNVDAFGNVTDTPLIPPSYALDPTVMLVPLQVVRVLPADPTTSNYGDLWNMTQRGLKKFFDGRPIVDTTQSSQPGFEYFSTREVNSTATVMTAPGTEQLSETDAYNAYMRYWQSADTIWSQCGIQFREIDCPTSSGSPQLGCPDLIVKSDDQVAPPTCEYNPGSLGNTDLPTLRANWDAAFNLPGVRSDLPLVITMATLVNAGACGGDGEEFPAAASQAQTTGLGLYALRNIGNNEFAVAHELGLLLGLNEETCTETDPKQLMCSFDGYMSATIRPEDCASARILASTFTKAKWGVTVTP